MKNFAIRVLDNNIIESYDMPCCIGEIQIGDFKETFEMPLEYWDIQTYRRQWDEGLARIRTHDSTCLVAEIQDPTKMPRVSLWVLYKDIPANVVYIQNRLLFGSMFTKILKHQPFTIDTCYNFIKDRKTVSVDGAKISEWHVPLDDLLDPK